MGVDDLEYSIEAIARIENDFTDKFGIPKQSGMLEGAESIIVFEPKYRSAEALRGIEGWSHLWLIWQFSENAGKGWSPTVRPPRLGGNKRVGVFATRSPYRPNSLGLSCVRLIGTEKTSTRGTILRVAGADLMNGTPIFDIKPYVAFADSVPGASDGLAVYDVSQPKISRAVLGTEAEKLPQDKRVLLEELLLKDPRPAYHDDPGREYGFSFHGYEVKFRVEGETVYLTKVIAPE